MRRLAGSFFALLALALAPTDVVACPACADASSAGMAPSSAGDGAAAQIWLGVTRSGETSGAPTTGLRVAETRAEFGLGVSVHARWQLTGRLPWVVRSGYLRSSSLRLARAQHIGDVETTARWVAWDRDDSAHRLSLTFGVRWPSGPKVRDDAGRPLLVDTQVGTGAFVGIAGVRHRAEVGSRLASTTSLVVLVPAAGRFPWQVGRNLHAQWELEAALGPLDLRLGPALRSDEAATLSGDREEDTGGTLLSAFIGAHLRAGERIYIDGQLSLPMFNALIGEQTRSPSLWLALGVQLHRKHVPESAESVAWAN